MSSKTANIKLIAVFLLLLSPTLFAAPNSSGFQPRIATQLKQEDNVRRAPDQNRQSDSILLLDLNLPLSWDFGKHKFDLNYKGEYAQYFDQKILNYNDQRLDARLLLDHNIRLNSEYKFGYIRDHLIPDDNNVVANLTDEPNQWEEGYAKAKVTYGSLSSPGQLITGLEYSQRNYTNNNQQSLDVNRLNLSAAFYYRIAPKTRIPFEISATNYDYQNTTPATDSSSSIYKYLTGVTWEATAKSTGIFQLGLLQRSYDNDRLKDTSIFMVRLDTVWKPRPYTKVVLSAIRDTQESSQVNSKAYIRNHINTKITHEMTSRTTLLFSSRYTAAKTDDLAAIKDNRFSVQLEIKHSLLNWLNVSAGYQYVGRNSDSNALDFQSNIIMLKIESLFNN